MPRATRDPMKTWKHTLIEAFFSFGMGFLKAFPKDRYMNSAGQCLDHVSPTNRRLNSRYIVNFSSFALCKYSPTDLGGKKAAYFNGRIILERDLTRNSKAITYPASLRRSKKA